MGQINEDVQEIFNYNVFDFKTKEDFILYLRYLIITTQIELDRYKVYLRELDKKIKDYGLEKDKHVKIPTLTFHDFNDKLRSLSYYLLNMVGEDKEGIISYKRFRKMADEMSEELEFELNELEEEIRLIIDQCSNNKAWCLHLSDITLNGQLQIHNKEMYRKIKNYVLIHNNPVEIPEYDYYEGAWLLDLQRKSQIFYDTTRKVFQHMKKDYSVLIEKSIRIKRKVYENRKYVGIELE
ncbi:MAG: hypothetical protein N4A57_18270 [Anaeromicrobium sp.]|jgi:hypothetical protein|uniref:hypothetical protein n=1 Tax=Anaeromicrobium sp. TaxID=1929132 RepID=UPI0025F35771|nr:hypothetical protein [Anaeromicrobium sp.]MCT4596196.1 hypothetical protein [Anaeromicrobium sp.]